MVKLRFSEERDLKIEKSCGSLLMGKMEETPSEYAASIP